MRFSEATGRKVVSTSSANTVGKVDGFVVDPVGRAVVAVLVKKAEGGDSLRWVDVTAFGADAVTVTEAAAIGELPPELQALTGKHHKFIGNRVLAATGDELGKLTDAAFDPESGAITGLLIGGEEIPGGRLLGIGSYAVVVAGA